EVPLGRNEVLAEYICFFGLLFAIFIELADKQA
ncbi:unnamed protein product, partial [marine sediment metagenome]